MLTGSKLLFAIAAAGVLALAIALHFFELGPALGRFLHGGQ
jgi:hypothetical protein